MRAALCSTPPFIPRLLNVAALIEADFAGGEFLAPALDEREAPEGGEDAVERVVARDARGQQQEGAEPLGVAFAVVLHVVEAAPARERAAQGDDEQVAEQMLRLTLLTRVWQLRELRRELPQCCMTGVGHAACR